MADLVSDIVGRVSRLPLKPSETNALLPLMEAFSNALHAVNLRFGDDAASKGHIQISILRESNEVIGFKIEDNGNGFTDEGMFGYTDNPKAFVEIVPFSKLLKDAKARNSAFFTRLGLNG